MEKLSNFTIFDIALDSNDKEWFIELCDLVKKDIKQESKKTSDSTKELNFEKLIQDKKEPYIHFNDTNFNTAKALKWGEILDRLIEDEVLIARHSKGNKALIVDSIEFERLAIKSGGLSRLRSMIEKGVVKFSLE